MPDWTDLKAWRADCWKTSWNVDPLPFSVPERLALLDDAAPLLGDVDGEEDEEHAARSRAVATTATPVAVT